MFFIIPIGVEYRASRYPVVTFTIIGINLVIYLLSFAAIAFGEATSAQWWFDTFGLVPADPKPHTFVTNWFIHAGFLHFIGNMIYLFLFGSCVEDIIGRWRFAVFYFLGGMAANLVHIIAASGPGAMMPLGGASGAVSACIGGFVLLLASTAINFRYFVLILVRYWTGEFSLPAWLVISFWFGTDLLSAIIDYSNPQLSSDVAFGAHVGGFLGGMAMIGFYKMIRRKPAVEELQERPIAPIRIATAVPEAPCIYLYEGGVQSGPFTPSQISDMLAIGTIGLQTLYWRDGMPDWRSVTELGASTRRGSR